MEEIEARIAALGSPAPLPPLAPETREETPGLPAVLPPQPMPAPETREELIAQLEDDQVAALDPPAPPPPPPAPAPKPGLAAQVDELYVEAGLEKREGAKLVTLITLLEEELLGQAGEGKLKDRVAVLREVL